MGTEDLQGEYAERRSFAPGGGAPSAWQRAKAGFRQQLSSLRQQYRNFDEARGRDLRMRASTASHRVGDRARSELSGFKEDLVRLHLWRNTKAEEEQPAPPTGWRNAWQRMKARVREISLATLIWTRRILAAVYITAAVLAVALIVFIVYWLNRPDPGPDLAISTTLQCENCEPLIVDSVIDGDTLNTNLGVVRTYGVETPAPGEACFTEATQAMEQLASTTVRAEPGQQQFDPFNRRLFYLYTESGRSIDEVLVRNGLALARVQDDQRSNFLLGLEREAAAAHYGCLWQ